MFPSSNCNYNFIEFISPIHEWIQVMGKRASPVTRRCVYPTPIRCKKIPPKEIFGPQFLPVPPYYPHGRWPQPIFLRAIGEAMLPAIWYAAKKVGAAVKKLHLGKWKSNDRQVRSPYPTWMAKRPEIFIFLGSNASNSQILFSPMVTTTHSFTGCTLESPAEVTQFRVSIPQAFQV